MLKRGLKGQISLLLAQWYLAEFIIKFHLPYILLNLDTTKHAISVYITCLYNIFFPTYKTFDSSFPYPCLVTTDHNLQPPFLLYFVNFYTYS